eukprot:9706533-Alexandrium_andersonii.AAC.1
MVLGSAAQPTTARSVVHDRPAIAGDGHARPGNCSVQQQLDGQRCGPRLGGQRAGAAVDASGSRSCL